MFGKKKEKFKDLTQQQPTQPPTVPETSEENPYKELLMEVITGINGWVDYALNKLKTLE